MRIRMKSMFGGMMSWSVVMRSLALELSRENDIFLDSINGTDLMSDYLLSRIMPCFNADLDLTYTIPQNFSTRFNRKSKIKAAIYNYESSILPKAWRDNHKHLDLILPSSNYCKNVFVNSGYPESKVFVIPHGINHSEFSGDKKCEDINVELFNFLNISIPHYRKNISKVLEAYYSEFSESDNVCLNIKTTIKPPKKYFELNVLDQLNFVQKKFNKKLPKVKIITKKYDSLFSLYNSCDALISATSSEGFGLPMLESMASKLLVLAPIQTGQSDFLNKNNCIDISGKYISAPKEYQYWSASRSSKIFMPSIDDIRFKMRMAFENSHKDIVNNAFEDSKEYTWKKACDKMMEIL